MIAQKWLRRTLLALLFCGLIPVFILLVWIDANDFKPQIIAVVQNATGRELTIDGELGLKFFPHLSVSVDSLTLGNSAGFTGSFLTLRKAYLKVRLLPLLQSRLEVVALDIEGLDLFLTRDAQGHENWLDLATPDQPEDTSTAESILKRDKRVPLLASLIVDGLKIAGTRIVWSDQRTDYKFEVRGVEIDVSNFAFGVPFEVHSRAQATFPSFAGQITVATRAVLEFDRLDLKQLKITGQIQGPNLAHSPESIILTADFFSTTGRLDNGRLRGLGLDTRFFAQEAPGVFTTGQIEVAPFDPKNVCARLGIALPVFVNPSVLSQASFTCNWTGDKTKLKISDLHLVVDNSTLKGALEISDQKGPFVALDLHVDTLNADYYRIHSSDNKKDVPDSLGLPIKELRSLNGNATLAIDSLTIANARCSKALIQGHLSSGILVLDTLEAQAYGGQVQASGSLDVSEDVPLWAWKHSLLGVQLGDLLQDVVQENFLDGTTQSTASLQTKGEDITALIRNLDGKFEFKVENGLIHGINISQSVRDTLRALKYKQSGPKKLEQTVFSVLSGRGIIKRGVETTHSLLLLTPRLRITGHGQADLVQETMDYGLTLHLQGSEGRFDEGLLGINSFPVRVTGPIEQPTITPDLGGVLKSLGTSGGELIEDTYQELRRGLQKIWP